MLHSCAANTSVTIGVQQILTASTASAKAASPLFAKPSLWREILKSGGKRGLGNPGPQIQSADILGPPVSTTGILHEKWHWYSLDHINEVWKSSGTGTMFQAEPCKATSTLCSSGGNKPRERKCSVSSRRLSRNDSTYWGRGGTKQNLQV